MLKILQEYFKKENPYNSITNFLHKRHYVRMSLDTLKERIPEYETKYWSILMHFVPYALIKNNRIADGKRDYEKLTQHKK